jgi:hypothetical protein
MPNSINKSTLKEKNKTRRRTKKAPYDSAKVLTGDIGLNINRFNQAMGTAPSNTLIVNNGLASSESGGGLTESKRYVRRYYIRPQNIFCSNKAEIIKALIELGNTNCSIYTLNNLGDDKDVTKLMNSDIIYYYDNGILFDKNKVKVMDYDLSIKKEENRKHFANVDKAPEKEFKSEYQDRMTDATELEESALSKSLNFTCKELEAALAKATANNAVLELGQSFDDEEACSYNWEIGQKDNEIIVTGWGYNIYTDEDGLENSSYFSNIADAYKYLENIAGSDPYAKISLHLTSNEAFNLDFEDYNVYGEKLTEAKENFCCICGEPIEGYGNNPEPYKSTADGVCCDGCNLKFVVPTRLELMKGE